MLICTRALDDRSPEIYTWPLKNFRLFVFIVDEAPRIARSILHRVLGPESIGAATLCTMAIAMFAMTLALLPGGPPLRSALLTPRVAAPVRCEAATEEGASGSAEIAVPKMESAVGFDFVPLLTALQAGEYREADQLTRDGLITMAGETAVKRGYVYFSEVPKLPVEDMCTLERLWQTYSGGKFGYAVQRACFTSKKVDGKFEDFFQRIGWKHGKDADRPGALLRWLPEARGDEFIYDVEKAPMGHLPLTSALRGTQLLAGLMEHPAWDTDGAPPAQLPLWIA